MPNSKAFKVLDFKFKPFSQLPKSQRPPKGSTGVRGKGLEFIATSLTSLQAWRGHATGHYQSTGGSSEMGVRKNAVSLLSKCQKDEI